METTFDTIIERLRNIHYDDIVEMNKLRPVAIEFLKRNLPNDPDLANTISLIQSLNFNPSYNSFELHKTSGNKLAAWNNALGTFLGIFEAKKETFNSETAFFSPAGDIAALKSIIESKEQSYAMQLKELGKQHQAELKEVNKKLGSNIEKLNNENKLLNKYNEHLKNEVAAIRSRKKKIDIGYWGALIGTIGVFFPIGYTIQSGHSQRIIDLKNDTIENLNVQNHRLKDSVTKLEVDFPLTLPIKKK